MDRRSFFKALRNRSTAVVATSAALTMTSDLPAKYVGDPKPLQSFKYKNWQILWTGWKPVGNNISIVGQWVAFPDHTDGWFVAASFPGAVGLYRKYDCLDISIHEKQAEFYVDANSPQNKLNDACAQCLKNLLCSLDTGEVDLLSYGEMDMGVGYPNFRIKL